MSYIKIESILKPNQARELIKSITDRGWVKQHSTYYTPSQAQSLGITNTPNRKKKSAGVKTGWTDDYRNIRNKSERTDEFIALLSHLLDLEVWPEFYFTVTRQWRFDYCIPAHKVYIEVEGGVWSGGRHVRGKGFVNDMEKYNSAAALGWRMIRITPSERLTEQTLKLIRETIFTK